MEAKSTSADSRPPPSVEQDDSRFVCNICLDPVRDAVVTLCGHLYCWPCLYRWLNTNHTTCPVCKAGVSKENVIPLYTKGSESDPRTKTPEVPNRPAGQRPFVAPPNVAGNQFGAQFGGMTFSAGFGFFPSLFGLQFQNFVSPIPDTSAGNAENRALTQEEIQQNFISRCLLMLGTFVIFCLLMF